LLSLGNLFAEASQIVYPDGPPVALNIKATEAGSFDVHLILHAQDIWDQVVDVLAGDAITALVNLKTLIAGGTTYGGYGLFAFIKWLRGREIISEEPAPEPGYVRITTEDASVEIPADVARMYRRISIRQRARDVVAPLNREGVEQVRFAESPEKPPELVIEKQDVPAYDAAASEPGDVLSDQEYEMLVSLASVSFEGHKWKLSNGTVRFWASIEDEEFLADVEANRERFGQWDLLRCWMRVVQLRRGGKLVSEYHVLQVREHIPGHMQPELWDEESPSD
jgi:hypothetical protein